MDNTTQTMTVEKVLRNSVEVGELCVFYDSGYQLGATIVDGEDLFISSLNQILLKQAVKSVERISILINGKDIEIVAINLL